MKKLKLFLCIVAVALGVGYCVHTQEEKHKKETPSAVVQTAATQMQIRNDSKDTVLVYLTLGATPGCIQNIGAIPFITDSLPGQRGLQGTFVLAPGDSTINYAPDSLGYNGVISFKFAPDNCATPAYPNGLNQFEFIINNAFQGPGAQESANISAVHGVNCVIRVDYITLNQFNAGPTVPIIQSYANTLDRNQSIAGVYPYGCDTCTGSKTLLPCIKYPQPAHKNSDCQTQRNAAQSGGLIKVIYLGKEQPLK
jgi:hypothetical protein